MLQNDSLEDSWDHFAGWRLKCSKTTLWGPVGVTNLVIRSNGITGVGLDPGVAVVSLAWLPGVAFKPQNVFFCTGYVAPYLFAVSVKLSKTCFSAQST